MTLVPEAQADHLAVPVAPVAKTRALELQAKTRALEAAVWAAKPTIRQREATAEQRTQAPDLEA